MDARRGFLQMPKVQLEQSFWVTEDSLAKLLLAGAKYVDMVTQKHHYYDTASDDLAMAGLWLSRRDQEWFLIVEAQEEGAQEKLEEEIKGKAADPVPHPGETLGQERAGDAQQDNALVRTEPPKRSLEEPDAGLEVQNQPLDSEAADSESERPSCSSAFTELVGQTEITAYLAAHLRLDWDAEGQEKATMEGFLQEAGIGHYASNCVVKRTMYRLSDRCTAVVGREEGSLRESATVLLEVDIFNLCQGLEEIEKLAASLGFEQQGIQSEGDFMA